MTKRKLTRAEYRDAKISVHALKKIYKEIINVCYEAGKEPPQTYLDECLAEIRELNKVILAWDKALLKIKELEVEIEDD